jgi:lysophospholipid acyltransferase (LPLAT)-like uncharacterized protein
VIRRILLAFGTLWVRSLRPRFAGATPESLPSSGILVLWHSDMLPCLRAFARQNMRVLISSSRDGDFGADAANRLGYRVVRGSSSRGGVSALKHIADDLSASGGWIALVADGPRGPRGVCKPGAVWLSQQTGIPVVCVTACARFGFTLSGWAKVRVPFPFSAVELRTSTPFHPENPEEIEQAIQKTANAF